MGENCKWENGNEDIREHTCTIYMANVNDDVTEDYIRCYTYNQI